MFFISDYIKKSIRYGKKPRNFLDIYTPIDKFISCCNNKVETNKLPVVIYITGGAWILGHKGWSALMGMVLSQLGLVVAAPDYRNFPQGTISDMIEDVSTAIEWIIDNIHEYGGDKSRIYLIAQSAGAHICTLSLLQQAYKLALKKNWNKN